LTAEEAFVSVGQQLQKQRQYESWDSLSVFLKDQADPADSNPDLESKLQNNYKEYAPRIQSVSSIVVSSILRCADASAILLITRTFAVYARSISPLNGYTVLNSVHNVYALPSINHLFILKSG
jgi:hypothetical protein